MKTRRELLLLLQSNTFWAVDGKINSVFFDSFSCFPKKVFCVLMSFLSRRYKVPRREEEDSTGA